MNWPEVLPFMGVSIRSGDLSLTAMTPDDIGPLLTLAERGIVPAGGAYPFITNWAMLPSAGRNSSSTRFYFSTWARNSPDQLQLMMVVRLEGEVVGAQDFMATDFKVRRVGETGSWLGREFHGRGIGTRMRQLVCAFAFDELGAVEMRTEAYADNPASNRVSQKTGYVEIDRIPVNRLGEAATEVRYKLTPGQLARPTEPIQYDGVAQLRTYLEL